MAADIAAVECYWIGNGSMSCRTVVATRGEHWVSAQTQIDSAEDRETRLAALSQDSAGTGQDEADFLELNNAAPVSGQP